MNKKNKIKENKKRGGIATITGIAAAATTATVTAAAAAAAATVAAAGAAASAAAATIAAALATAGAAAVATGAWLCALALILAPLCYLPPPFFPLHSILLSSTLLSPPSFWCGPACTRVCTDPLVCV